MKKASDASAAAVARQIAVLGEGRCAVSIRSAALVQGSDGSRGVSCLFKGLLGPGSEIAARRVAQGLGMDLRRIDLSRVVSKYVGETEKALARIFEEAESTATLLLFDEADALFARRDEVKDRRHRYADVAVANLLDRMQSSRGISILAVSRDAIVDPALLRRLRLVVEFPPGWPDAGPR